MRGCGSAALQLPALLLDPVIGRVDGGELVVGQSHKFFRHAAGDEADGVLHPGELAFLERVAEIFGFSQAQFRRIRASHFGPDEADPYAILGVAHNASNAEVKSTYRFLVRENHPDSLIARGVPEEFIRLANDKLAAINAAYDRIEQERGKL